MRSTVPCPARRSKSGPIKANKNQGWSSTRPPRVGSAPSSTKTSDISSTNILPTKKTRKSLKAKDGGTGSKSPTKATTPSSIPIAPSKTILSVFTPSLISPSTNPNLTLENSKNSLKTKTLSASKSMEDSSISNKLRKEASSQPTLILTILVTERSLWSIRLNQISF